MTAPTPVTRLAPNGIRLEDGYRCIVGTDLDPDLAVWEIGVQPSGRDGQDPVNTNTMWNDTYFTKAPRALVDTTDMVLRVAYDPAVLPNIDAVVNVRGNWTATYPNGDTETVYGFLRSFIRAELVEGTMPEATMTITLTNTDANGNEEGPVYSGTSGTGG